MAVYKNDNPAHFEEALLSVWNNQILKPFEIILVQDGPVPTSVNNIICKWKRLNSSLVLLINDSNIGLTKSLNKGLMMCSGNLLLGWTLMIFLSLVALRFNQIP